MLCRVGHARYLAVLDRARAAGVGWERRRMDWSGRGGQLSQTERYTHVTTALSQHAADRMSEALWG